MHLVSRASTQYKLNIDELLILIKTTFIYQLVINRIHTFFFSIFTVEIFLWRQIYVFPRIRKDNSSYEPVPHRLALAAHVERETHVVTVDRGNRGTDRVPSHLVEYGPHFVDLVALNKNWPIKGYFQGGFIANPLITVRVGQARAVTIQKMGVEDL
jgi:hypothetical protein